MTDMGVGATANPNKQAKAIEVSIKIPRTRFLGGISDITFMPMNLDSIYPETWNITKADLRSIPKAVMPLYEVEVNGLRIPYMQK